MRAVRRVLMVAVMAAATVLVPVAAGNAAVVVPEPVGPWGYTNGYSTGGGGTLTNSWGNWCGTCHGDFNSGDKAVHHPIDVALGADISGKYNAYVGSGNMTGTAATSYLSLVPFAEATTDYAQLKLHAKNNDSYLQGPAAGDAVTCLSCHRAHASAFDSMVRWDQNATFLTDAGAFTNGITTDRGTTATAAGYYGRAVVANATGSEGKSFGPYQRSLCNKCHGKD